MSGEVTAATWTSEDVEKLIDLWSEGHTVDAISQLMDRSIRSIECKVLKLRRKGVAFKARVGNSKEGRVINKKPSFRTRCMTCREYFTASSEHIHICPECTESGLFNGIAAQYA